MLTALATIKDSRSVRLEAIRDECVDFGAILESNECLRPNDTSSQHLCASLQCGSFLRAIRQSFDYTEWRTLKNWTGSIRDYLIMLDGVFQKLEMSRERHFRRHGGNRAWSRHRDCTEFQGYAEMFRKAVQYIDISSDFCNAYYRNRESD